MAQIPVLAPEAWLKFTVAVENSVQAEATTKSIADVLQCYVDLPGRELKYKARKFLDDYVTSAVTDGDHNRARICAAIIKVCKSKGWRPDPGTPSQVALHREKYLELVMALQKAYSTAVAEIPDELRAVMPNDFYEHLDDGIDDVIIYRRWMLSKNKGTEAEPKVSEVDKQAARMSLGRAPGMAGRPIPSTKVKRK